MQFGNVGNSMGKKALNLDNVLGIIRKRKADFEADFGITDIGIFGSLARGEGTHNSDVDILVKMNLRKQINRLCIKKDERQSYMM